MKVEEVSAQPQTDVQEPPVPIEQEYDVAEHKIITTTHTRRKKTKTIIDEDGNEHVEVLEDVDETNQQEDEAEKSKEAPAIND